MIPERWPPLTESRFHHRRRKEFDCYLEIVCTAYDKQLESQFIFFKWEQIIISKAIFLPWGWGGRIYSKPQPLVMSICSSLSECSPNCSSPRHMPMRSDRRLPALMKQGLSLEMYQSNHAVSASERGAGTDFVSIHIVTASASSNKYAIPSAGAMETNDLDG